MFFLSSELERCLTSQAKGKRQLEFLFKTILTRNKDSGKPSNRKEGKTNLQPQAVRLQLVFVTIQADSKGGEEQGLAPLPQGHSSPVPRPHHRPRPCGTPVPGHPHRQGTRSLLPPLPISDHLFPPPASAHQFSPAWT